MSRRRTHHITTTDGVTIGGTVHGQGPPLVFLQGAMGDGDLDWQALLPPGGAMWALTMAAQSDAVNAVASCEPVANSLMDEHEKTALGEAVVRPSQPCACVSASPGAGLPHRRHRDGTLQTAQQRWRRVNVHELVALVRAATAPRSSTANKDDPTNRKVIK